ncbi:MAG: ExbD/TolR family protein [Burkholderiaceae bacterium]
MNEPLSFNRSNRRSKVVSLTPLIDVVFMLLLFFMLATSFEHWRSIELSAGSEQLAQVDKEREFILLEVTPEYLNVAGAPVSLEQIKAQLNARSETTRLVVKPVDEVSLQRLVTVMDEISAAGIEQPIVSID